MEYWAWLLLAKGNSAVCCKAVRLQVSNLMRYNLTLVVFLFGIRFAISLWCIQVLHTIAQISKYFVFITKKMNNVAFLENDLSRPMCKKCWYLTKVAVEHKKNFYELLKPYPI